MKSRFVPLSHWVLFLAISTVAARDTLLDINFFKSSAASDFNSSFANYAIPGAFVGDNGNVSFTRNMLVVDSTPFTKSVPLSPFGTLDHVKYLTFNKDTYKFGSTYNTITCSISMKVEVKAGPLPSVFGSVNSATDPRLAAGAFVTIDQSNTFIVADFMVTSSRVYALYERLPFARTATHVYGAFTHMIPVASITESNEVHTYAIEYNRRKRTITWLVDDSIVFTVDNVGYRLSPEYRVLDLGGIDESVFPESIQCGPGTFSLLDFYPPCELTLSANGARSCRRDTTKLPLVQLVPDGYVNCYNSSAPVVFADSTENYKLFGQGANLYIRRILVTASTSKVCSDDW